MHPVSSEASRRLLAGFGQCPKNMGRMLSNLGHRDELLQINAETVLLSMCAVLRDPQAFLDRFRSGLQDPCPGCEALGQDPNTDPLVRQSDRTAGPTGRSYG